MKCVYTSQFDSEDGWKKPCLTGLKGWACKLDFSQFSHPTQSKKESPSFKYHTCSLEHSVGAKKCSSYLTFTAKQHRTHQKKFTQRPSRHPWHNRAKNEDKKQIWKIKNFWATFGRVCCWKNAKNPIKNHYLTPEKSTFKARSSLRFNTHDRHGVQMFLNMWSHGLNKKITQGWFFCFLSVTTTLGRSWLKVEC